MTSYWNNLVLMCNFAFWLFVAKSESETAKKGFAALHIAWDYDNPGSKLENGLKCKLIFGGGCSVRFKMCLQKADSHSTSCDLHHQETHVYKNVKSVKDEIRLLLKQPLPKAYNMEFIIFGRNFLRQFENIAVYSAHNFKLVPNEQRLTIPLRRAPTGYKNQVSLSMQASLRCGQDYYGDRCETHCRPPGPNYTCTPQGNIVCKPDTDCPKPVDACSQSPCANGGVCLIDPSDNEAFTCQCTELWSGSDCTIRRSACNESTGIGTYTGDSTDGVGNPCLNNGVCIDDPHMLTFTCACTDEWEGSRCEISRAPFRQMNKFTLILITVTCLFGILLLALGILLCIGCHRKQQKRSKSKLFRDGGLVYYHGDRVNKIFVPQFTVRQTEWSQISDDTIFARGTRETHSFPDDTYDECKNDQYLSMDPDGITKPSVTENDIDTEEDEQPPPLPERPQSHNEKHSLLVSNTSPFLNVTKLGACNRKSNSFASVYE
ncbi:hypothetical protein PHET_06193 [Paragonimus heterotremus]|uniref:EGF-like domain-containing protein n=1 Tax=Paragonimus heterotremus TaxID=100268 RepID=A0A8J4WR45_9TREM|nr:hypothetical protein PHET_06193 [Paragonimus heterotremus]